MAETAERVRIAGLERSPLERLRDAVCLSLSLVSQVVVNPSGLVRLRGHKPSEIEVVVQLNEDASSLVVTARLSNREVVLDTITLHSGKQRIFVQHKNGCEHFALSHRLVGDITMEVMQALREGLPIR